MVAKGRCPKDDNPLINAPHTAEEAVGDDWSHAYSRKLATFPGGADQVEAKYWPPVARIDNVYGDRNLICSCPPFEQLAS